MIEAKYYATNDDEIKEDEVLTEQAKSIYLFKTI